MNHISFLKSTKFLLVNLTFKRVYISTSVIERTQNIGAILPLTYSFLSRTSSHKSQYTVSFYKSEIDERFLSSYETYNEFKLTTVSSKLDGSGYNQSNQPKYFTNSFVELTLPFGSDHKLRDVFRRPDFNLALRWGLILELSDAISGDVAYRHSIPEGRYVDTTDITIVTLSIDGMQFNHLKVLGKSYSLTQKEVNYPHMYNDHGTIKTPNFSPLLINEYSNFLPIDQDFTIRAFTSFVGTTSLEVRIEMFQNSILVGSGFFVMVALDTTMKRPIKLPKLKSHPLFPNLNSLFEEGQMRTLTRKQINLARESTFTPTHTDMEYLHNRFLEFQNNTVKKKLFGSDPVINQKYISTNDTVLKSVMIMHHDKRNVHNKIFGGYIVRKAFELSWLTTQLFIQSPHPSLKAIDQIFFLKPVEVGAMIEMEARVIFTESDEIQIEVEAKQINPINLEKLITNNFIFIYDQNKWKPNIKAIPQDYNDCLKFISGFHRYKHRKKYH